MANYGTNNIGILIVYGNGVFDTMISYSTGAGSAPYSVAIADFNNDNRSDIVVTNSETNNVATFLGHGNGTFANPVMLGVMLGLLFGKFIGITGACWLALKLNIGRLPTGARFSQIAAVSVLAGIGFTMSIFIAELAFKGQAEHLLMAKTGVIFASLIAATLGFSWLWLLGKPKH